MLTFGTLAVAIWEWKKEAHRSTPTGNNADCADLDKSNAQVIHKLLMNRIRYAFFGISKRILLKFHPVNPVISVYQQALSVSTILVETGFVLGDFFHIERVLIAKYIVKKMSLCGIMVPL